MTKTFYIEFAISGSGSAMVEAETEEEALEKAINGEFSEDAEIVEWDMNTRPYSGGHISATEETT